MRSIAQPCAAPHLAAGARPRGWIAALLVAAVLITPALREVAAKGRFSCRKGKGSMRKWRTAKPYGPAYLPGPIAPGQARQFRFPSIGARIAGQLDRPVGLAAPPVIFLIHGLMRHDRDGRAPANRKFMLYKWLAEYFVSHGFAFYRFDKRGAGKSRILKPPRGGDAADYVAGYRMLIEKLEVPASRIVILAQSQGTIWLTRRWRSYLKIGKPRGVILFSNILGPAAAAKLGVPVHVVMGEWDDCQGTFARDVARAHNKRWKLGSSWYWGRGADHPLFDVRRGDWNWWEARSRLVYHQGALDSMARFAGRLFGFYR